MSQQAPPEAEARETIESRNPATGELLGSVQVTPPERIDGVVRAVGAGAAAVALLRVEDRARYMRRMAQAIIDELDELVEAIGPRAGPPARGGGGARALAGDRRADLDRRRRGEGAGRTARGDPPLDVARAPRADRDEPYGVIGVIGAGSAPFAQPLGQIAGALLAGTASSSSRPRALLDGRADRAGAGARGPAGGAGGARARRRAGRGRAGEGVGGQGAVHGLARVGREVARAYV